VTTMTSDQARGLLGGGLNGHDVLAGHADHNGVTLLTTPHRWQWKPRPRQRREVRAGSRLIGTGGVLLFLLGAALLAVSFAAQYQYVLHERHQHIASLIEAGALDVGLIIFSLLALGLARAGLSAKIERAAVIGCAIGSAVMNYAAADVTSPRSVLAYCMPPVFLAFVVDRVVRTVQRHVLGMSEARSPWSVLTDTGRRIARFWLLSVLYVLRFLVDRRNTCAGLKQALLNATPLPAAPAQPQAEEHKAEEEFTYCPALVAAGPVRLACRKVMPCADHPQDDPQWVATHCLATVGADAFCAKPTPCPNHDRLPRGCGTKTARFLEEVRRRHGDLSTIPLGQVSKIATAIAPDADLHPASARTALLSAVRAALPPGEGDSK
jgi:hypothetical protein